MSVVSDQRLKVRPRVWIGLAIWVAELLLVLAVQSASGIPYDQWGDSAGNLFLGAGLSLIVSAVLLAITVTLLGWWRPVLHDRQRSHHRWPIVFPILVALAAVMLLAGTDWGAYSGAFLAASLVLCLVGFTEEIVNIALGADAGPTVLQVVFAFATGTTFYILRRVTGSLVWAMLLHALWDFSVFAAGIGKAGDIAAIGNVLETTAGFAAVAFVVFVIRGARERNDDHVRNQHASEQLGVAR